ncbi:hypothetical protein F5148DRAFT_1255992 [Russula earlei]|uniref:Uncharacterized protein n=1 Tax=Russula earlei TaxID=71964 RepID=A0ACC0TTD2_9AGAM|nr:hypothetical protein F5148DRAFT_1255992 [Russula earlei]
MHDKKGQKKASGDPNDWTVEEVSSWLEGRGFKPEVCDMFTAQQISGNILLSLDAGLLKSEFRVVPYGTRVNIENAIKTLLPDDLLSDSDLDALHAKLKAINPDADWYSNPQNITILPFPFLTVSLRLPSDRFRLLPECNFQYMGREAFARVWAAVGRMRTEIGLNRIYIQGTIGYGKSHILAALACLLGRGGNRVVYLPDCREMLRGPLIYLKSALLCAFADPSSSHHRTTIRACRSNSDLLAFCRANANPDPLYFVVDQMNAFHKEESNEDEIANDKKQEFSNLLQEMSAEHYSITCASANRRTMMHMQRKQTGDLKLSMMGGMSKVRRPLIAFPYFTCYSRQFPQEEMKYWWLHHKTKVPIFEDEADRYNVEDLTGRIPLLLRPFLTSDGKVFSAVEQTIWQDKDLVAVRRNIHKFANRMRTHNTGIDYEMFYLSTIFASLTRSTTHADDEWFDHRYFYRDEETQICHCTCGLARKAGAILLRQANPDRFFDSIWLNSLDFSEGHPAMVGFIVEQTCLSAISSLGFKHTGIQWDPAETTIFEGDLLQALPRQTSTSKFFVPADPNYKNIDALYYEVDTTAKTVFVAPIQITVNPKHKDSEALFYSEWGRWKTFFVGYTLSSTFVWILEHAHSRRVIEQQSKALRSGSRVIIPEHEQIFVTVTELYAPLGRQLTGFRKTSGRKRLRPVPSIVPDDEISEKERPPRRKKIEGDVTSTDAPGPSAPHRPAKTQGKVKLASPPVLDEPLHITAAADDGSPKPRRSSRTKK